MSEPPPKLIRIFISSPSDVAEERRAAAELIEQELAKREAFRKPLKLDVFRYDDPQSEGWLLERALDLMDEAPELLD